MNDEQELRDRFEAITVPPSRLEVDALVAAGRRRTFLRRSGQAAGGVALATGLLVAVPTMVIGRPGPPEPITASPGPAGTVAKSCGGAALRVPAGVKGASANGVDPTGRYIIGHYFQGQDFRPLLWTDGVPRKLPLEAPSMQLNSVNANGVAAGLAEGPNIEYAFRYENGKYTRLRTPPGKWHVYPYPMMNAAGDVVMNAEPQGKSGGADGIALLWEAGSTTPITLPLPGNANVYDITDDGLIVGGLFEDGGAHTPYVWDRTGRGRELKVAPGLTSAAYSAEGDWATGGLWPESGSGTPALWNLRTGKFTELPGQGPGDVVNSDGWVLAAHELIRDNQKVTLVAPKDQNSAALGLSDTGLVVGHTLDNDDTILAPRSWQC
ncbi:MAG TPA: hypothetical protein VFG35_22555 [Actinoplanes sp.]|nr:hypothetical protein [Actinoplanes sp.]